MEVSWFSSDGLYILHRQKDIIARNQILFHPYFPLVTASLMSPVPLGLKGIHLEFESIHLHYPWVLCKVKLLVVHTHAAIYTTFCALHSLLLVPC